MTVNRSKLAFRLLGYRYGFNLNDFIRLVKEDQY